jgi:hypothetical protein
VDDAHAFHDAAPSAERVLEQDRLIATRGRNQKRAPALDSRSSATQRWGSPSTEIVWECVPTITVLDSAINFAAAKRIRARSSRFIPRDYHDTSRQSASGSGSPGSHFRSRRLVTRNVAFLNNYNIPELVTRRFIAALFLSGFRAASGWAISVELIIRKKLVAL